MIYSLIGVNIILQINLSLESITTSPSISLTQNLKKVFLSWDDVNTSLMEIKKYVLSIEFQADSIVTVYKGGVIPGIILSYYLNITSLETIRFDLRGELIFSNKLPELKNKSVLLIDNILDDGTKLAYTTQLLQEFYVKQIIICTLCVKDNSTCVLKSHFSPIRIKSNEWVVYPWEQLNY